MKPLQKALQMEREIVSHLMIDEADNPIVYAEWREACAYTDEQVRKVYDLARGVRQWLIEIGGNT